jgi:hypothetical protein
VQHEQSERAPPLPIVYSSICWSPTELPKAAVGARPMCWWMVTGLPALSLLKFNCGRRMRTGFPSRSSNLVLMLLPMTCSGVTP